MPRNVRHDERTRRSHHRDFQVATRRRSLTAGITPEANSPHTAHMSTVRKCDRLGAGLWRALPADGSVDKFVDEVDVSVVPRVLLDHEWHTHIDRRGSDCRGPLLTRQICRAWETEPNPFMVLCMDVLVLGGTSFLGRAIVTDLVKHGHTPTLFTRGKTGVELFPGVERLIGDRANGEYAALRVGVGHSGGHQRLPPAPCQ